jgi:S-adenosyl-L-methionine hydrolase (adenosine-forming)
VSAVISLLTDFGLVDGSVGACRGVLASIAPQVPVVDIGHLVPPFDVARGAGLLEYAVPYYPAGAIHVAVVDPGVGTPRRPVAIRSRRGNVLIGPDNGLLMWATDRLGGVDEAVELREDAYRLHPVSHTFHARDIFCPAAAHLATGVPLTAFGPHLIPDSLKRLPRPQPIIGDGEVRADVTYIANFGNCHFEVSRDDWERAGLKGLPTISVEGDSWRKEVPYRETFGSVGAGQVLLLHDSVGRLCLAVNQGDASATLGLQLGTPVRFRRHP